MRILLATTAPFPHVGGLSTHIQMLLDGLQRHGHDVEIIHPYSDPGVWRQLTQEMAAVGLPMTPLNYIEAAQAILELQFLKRAGRYDVIHAHDSIAWNALADVVPHDTPFVLTQHAEYDIRWEMPNLTAELVEYTELCQLNGLRHSDELICVGDGVARDFARVSGRSPRVLKSMVDIPRFEAGGPGRAEIFRELGLNPNTILLFAPHRMEPLKGNRHLIEAVDNLVKSGRTEFHLIVAGKGQETPALRDLVSQRQLEAHVTLLDSIPWEMIPRYYRAAHLFLMASYTEGLPMALLEAMAAGLPTVATYCRGVDETVRHGETGLLVEHDARQIADAILKLVDDQALYQRFSAAARQAVEAYGLDALIERLLAVYQSVQPHPRHRVREHTGRMYLAIRRVGQAMGLAPEKLPTPFRLLLGSLDYPRMGGVTSHIRKLLRALRKRGILVDVVHPGKPGLIGPEYVAARKAVERIAPPRQPDMLDRYWDQQASEIQIQAAALREMGLSWDAVHGHDIVSTARLMAVIPGVPFYCTTHGPAVEEELAKGNVKSGSAEEAYLRHLEATVMERCEQVFIVGAHLLERTRARYPRAPLTLMPNWVDTDQFKRQEEKGEARRRLGLPEEGFLVFSPSRMDFNKGLEYLIQAAPEIDGPVVLVRSRPDADAVVRSHHRGGEVRLIDPVDVNQMPELYGAMDVCVLPSIRMAGTQESFPIAALEAVSCEIPLVATGVGGLGEILAKVELEPVAEKSAEAIAERVNHLRAHPDEAAAAARSARELLCGLYSEAVIVDRIAEAYRAGKAPSQGPVVLPYRNLMAHLEQVAWLLRQDRKAEANAVHRQRKLEVPEREYLSHGLAFWLDELTGPGSATWRESLHAWMRAGGWNPAALTMKYEPALPGVHELAAHWRHTEYTQRAERLSGEQARLVEAPRGEGPIHVVYVMAHVAVTGGAKVIFDHANHLVDLGVHVTIVCHYPKPDWYPVRCDYLQVPFQIDVAQAIPPCDVIVATYWDHVQACVDTGLAPTVYFEQGDFHLFEEISPDQMETVRKSIGSAAAVTTCSDRIARIIPERFGREVAQVFPNAVDRTSYFPGPQGERVGKRPYLMMMGSDQVTFKGTREVLQAYQQVKAMGIDLDLVWVSPKPLVQPAGQVYVNPEQQVLAELYRGASVFISGSHYETFPLPPLEAMASGCPVVTTANQGVLTYAQDGVNCLLAEIGNPSSLAEQIIRLMKDDELQRRLREGGLRTAEQYDWTATAGQLKSFYESLASMRPEPRNRLSDWEVTTRPFLTDDGWTRLEQLLAWTDADLVMAPIVIPVFEGHVVARWAVVAERRNRTSQREARLWSPVLGEVTDLPYAPAWALFIQERYGEALVLFKELFQSARDSAEQGVYLRWIILCLLEQGMDAEALGILRDAVRIHHSNTDLVYLRALLLNYQGRSEDVAGYRERAITLADSASYPEFFWGVADLAAERLQPA